MLCTVFADGANGQGLAWYNWVPEILRPGMDWMTKRFRLEKRNETALAEFKKVTNCVSVLTARFLQNLSKRTWRTFYANQDRVVAAWHPLLRAKTLKQTTFV